jgi:hypothetical protein
MKIFHGMFLEFIPLFRIQKIDGLAYYFADALLSRSLIALPSPSSGINSAKIKTELPSSSFRIAEKRFLASS